MSGWKKLDCSKNRAYDAPSMTTHSHTANSTQPSYNIASPDFKSFLKLQQMIAPYLMTWHSNHKDKNDSQYPEWTNKWCTSIKPKIDTWQSVKAQLKI